MRTPREVELDRAGRVKVGPDLSLPSHPEVFVIGDTAWVTGEDGTPLPGVAPVAIQQGQFVARLMRDRLQGDVAPRTFHYVDKGNLATIGRASAVADFGQFHLTGFVAWVLWGVVHISYLIGFRNRVVVLIEWLWAYLTSQRGARLITSVDKE